MLIMASKLAGATFEFFFDYKSEYVGFDWLIQIELGYELIF